jgi:hypothetical protein
MRRCHLRHRHAEQGRSWPAGAATAHFFLGPSPLPTVRFHWRDLPRLGIMARSQALLSPDLFANHKLYPDHLLAFCFWFIGRKEYSWIPLTVGPSPHTRALAAPPQVRFPRRSLDPVDPAVRLPSLERRCRFGEITPQIVLASLVMASIRR